MANRFKVRSDTTLRAVQIATIQPGVSYTVSVYTGNIKSTSPTSGGVAQALTLAGETSVSGTWAYGGYNTVPFEKPVILKKGQKFSIVVTLYASDGEAYFPVEVGWRYISGRDKLTLSAGQSFIKEDGKWKDLKPLYKRIRATGFLGNFNIIGLTSTGPAYTLYYDAGAGTVASASKEVAFGKKLGTLATPKRPGYAFSGWYTSESGGIKYTATTRHTAMDDATVYARWTAKKYQVTFNANGGTEPKSDSKVKKTKTVTFDSVFGPLPTTTRKGYTFDGWFTAKSGGELVTAESEVVSAKNVTLYAHWTVKE